jgi:hypothetical protein
MEANRPLCLSCADLDRLIYLPRGDAALTRRAAKYSRLSTVVVRFSRTRKRYERQGLLVEEAALERAEQECLANAEAREAARVRAAERREGLEEAYVRSFERRIGEMFPHCPEPARRAIAEHACQRHSGRVGRSATAKMLDPEPVALAVRAHIRHECTRYDELLAQGADRGEARALVRGEVDEILQQWQDTTDDGS